MGNEVMSVGRLLKQANQLKRMGKLDEAIALYRQAIEINPNTVHIPSLIACLFAGDSCPDSLLI